MQEEAADAAAAALDEEAGGGEAAGPVHGGAMVHMSTLLPTFLRRLADPEVRTIMISGCGGGFDFVHSLALLPELKALGKRVVFASFSFGKPGNIRGDATETVYERGEVLVKVRIAG